MVSGLPNESTRCYLNAVMQAVRVCVPDFSYSQEQLYSDLHLQDGPQDAHETWLRLIDKYPKETFYGTRRETCVSKTGKEEHVVDFSCIHACDAVEEYITTSDGFVLKRVDILTVPKVMTYLFDGMQTITFEETNPYGKKLTAFIVHGIGHYVAIVREGDEWFLANDMHVEKMTNFDYTVRAYMAFYV